MTKAFTKPQLVAAMAERMDAHKTDAAAALDALVAIITEQVSAGGGVTIPDIGKISSRDRPERMVRNPATGEHLKKAADRQVKMSVARRLKDRVNS